MIASRAALTEAQREAVEHTTGPLLIVAGAGTGKTRVLVERYRRLRQDGVPAERILLLTFTEKAAREVLDRVEQEDYLPAGERFILTYHAFAQRFLQEDGWLCGTGSLRVRVKCELVLPEYLCLVTSIPSFTRSGRPSASFRSSAPSGRTLTALRVSALTTSATAIGSVNHVLQVLDRERLELVRRREREDLRHEGQVRLDHPAP